MTKIFQNWAKKKSFRICSAAPQYHISVFRPFRILYTKCLCEKNNL